MIDILNLRSLAKTEYLKEEGNYLDKSKKILRKMHILDKYAEPYSQLPNELAEINFRLHKERLECVKIANSEISFVAASMLCDPKYSRLLAENSEQLGNKNLKNESMVNLLQEYGLFSSMWMGLFNSDDNTMDDLEKFVTGVDIVLDAISQKNGTNFVDIINFNKECKRQDISLARVLHKQVSKLGKEQTIKLLNTIADPNGALSELPISYRVVRLKSIIDITDENEVIFYRNVKEPKEKSPEQSKVKKVGTRFKK